MVGKNDFYFRTFLYVFCILKQFKEKATCLINLGIFLIAVQGLALIRSIFDFVKESPDWGNGSAIDLFFKAILILHRPSIWSVWSDKILSMRVIQTIRRTGETNLKFPGFRIIYVSAEGFSRDSLKIFCPYCRGGYREIQSLMLNRSKPAVTRYRNIWFSCLSGLQHRRLSTRYKKANSVRGKYWITVNLR